MSQALTRPPAVPLSANIAGIRSQTARARPNANTAIISNGASQSARVPSRARSNPLAESFAPRKLTCLHGRKKQISANSAAPSVVRLAFSILRLRLRKLSGVCPLQFVNIDLLHFHDG